MESRDFVQSLERGLAILQAFDINHTVMTLTEAAARTGMTRAAARRFLLTLVELKFVGTDGKRFWLRPSVLNIGHAYLTGQPWWHVAQPIVEELARSTNESCSVCVLDGTDTVYVCRAAISRIVSSNLTIGSRIPAYCSAMGRALLAQLPPVHAKSLIDESPIQKLTPLTVTSRRKLMETVEKVRQQGFSLLDQELDLGLRALAVPIKLPSDNVVAALGISVHANRVSNEALMQNFLPAMLERARQISKSLQEMQRSQVSRAIQTDS